MTADRDERAYKGVSCDQGREEHQVPEHYRDAGRSDGGEGSVRAHPLGHRTNSDVKGRVGLSSPWRRSKAFNKVAVGNQQDETRLDPRDQEPD